MIIVLHPHASLEMKLNPSVFFSACYLLLNTDQEVGGDFLSSWPWVAPRGRRPLCKITHPNKTVNKEFKGAVLLNFSDFFLSSGSLVVQPPQWLLSTNDNNRKMNKQAQQQKKNNPLDTLFDKMDSRPINTRLGFLLKGWMQNQKKIRDRYYVGRKGKLKFATHGGNNWLEEKATETIAFTFVVCPLLIKTEWWAGQLNQQPIGKPQWLRAV